MVKARTDRWMLQAAAEMEMIIVESVMYSQPVASKLSFPDAIVM